MSQFRKGILPRLRIRYTERLHSIPNRRYHTSLWPIFMSIRRNSLKRTRNSKLPRNLLRSGLGLALGTLNSKYVTERAIRQRICWRIQSIKLRIICRAGVCLAESHSRRNGTTNRSSYWRTSLAVIRKIPKDVFWKPKISWQGATQRKPSSGSRSLRRPTRTFQ